MICRNCGAQLPDGTTFCTNCGCAVDAAQAQPQYQQPAQPQYQQPAQPQYQQPAQPQYQQPAQPQYQQPAQPQYQQPAQPQYQQPAQPQYQQPAQPQYQQPSQPMYQQPAYQTAPVVNKKPSPAALILSIIGFLFSGTGLLLLLRVNSVVSDVWRAAAYAFSGNTGEELAGQLIIGVIFAFIGLIFGIISTVKAAKGVRAFKPSNGLYVVALIFGIICLVASVVALIMIFPIVSNINYLSNL